METIPKSFREFKARKAKFGFSSSLCLKTAHSVAMAVDVMTRFDPAAIMDERTGGMYPEVNFYTNNEQAAEAFRAECVENR
jgi:hypothetical protein